ncbi:MAG: hypothetical protein ABI318_19985, partial [Chthoniobacteraceae bacterium]
MTLTHTPASGDLAMTVESTVAPTRSEKEGAHLATARAAKYTELLTEKNRLIAQYKAAPDALGAGVKDSDVLVSLRRSIEEKKAAAREVLDRLLLAEFQRLGIQFQQATWISSTPAGDDARTDGSPTHPAPSAAHAGDSTARAGDTAAHAGDAAPAANAAPAPKGRNMPAQGNALGSDPKRDKALKGRPIPAGKDGKPEKRPLKLDDIRALQPFHWAYEFDHILIDRGGFDAIITNPPWENFKPDDKEFFMPLAEDVSKNKMRLEDFIERKAEVLTADPAMRAQYLAYLSRFPHVNLWFRNSEQYENQTAIVNGRKATTDLNLYKLFLEQTLHLLHAGGYCGIVIPGGIYSDLGATRLRQMLFEKTRITGLFGFENRREIFENVHRSFKFVVLTFRPGDQTTQFPAAFMRHEVKDLATFPEASALQMEVKLIRQLSPDSLSVLEFRDERDVEVARKLTQFPLLGDEGKHPWHLTLQREFHMTDDAPLYHREKRGGYVPLVEGKMFHQFLYPYAEPRYWLDPKAARAALLTTRLNTARRLAESAGITATVKPEQVRLDYESYRLVFRDVAR